MKTSGLIAALVTLALAGCQKPVAETEPDTEPPPPAATPAPATPAAVVAKVLPAATPVPRELAPAGRFYLRTKKSITTEDGIVGLPLATGLRETAPGEYVTDTGQQVTLAAHEVTNDLAEARQLASYNAAARAALANSLNAADAAETARAAQAAKDAAAEASKSARRVAPAAAPAARPMGSSLNPNSELGKSHSSTNNSGVDGSGRRFWTDETGRRYYK